AVAYSSGAHRNSLWGFFQNVHATRLRELAVGFRIPSVWAARIGAESAVLTLSGRNLALWTNYRGVDPEVQAVPGSASTPFGDLGGIPDGRHFTLRLELGF